MRMMLGLEKSLQLKIYAALIGVLTVTLIISGIFNYQDYRSTLFEQLSEEIKLASDRLAHSSAEPLWNADQEQLAALLKSEMLSKSVAGIAIKAADEPRFGFYKQGKKLELFTPKTKLPYELKKKEIIYDSDGELSPLGQLLVYVDKGTLIAKLNSRLIAIIFEIIILNIILLMCLSLLLRRIVIKPLRQISAAINDIAAGEGDLTQRVQANSADEIGDLGRGFNLFVDKIHTIIAAVSHRAINIDGGSDRIETINSELAGHMDIQAKHLGSVGDSVAEVQRSIANVEKLAGGAAAKAMQSVETAKSGGTIVKNNIESMHSISDAVNKSASSIRTLGELGESINSVIETINTIASQTNLLALNAAIEAARAGEQGRGFAVVADEVRKLAIRTAEATDEVAPVIRSIQTEVQHSVEQMNEGVSRVDAGVNEVTRAGEMLDEIVMSVTEVTRATDEIAAAVSKQTTSTTEVKNFMQETLSDIEQLKDGTYSASESAKDLSQGAKHLMKLVNQFTIDADLAKEKE
ncbi:methyl-accepting chemotaxis protein [Piscirickettsia salmonis]|uniref:methyl-accepting chemotaxis protein n=3 Tax=Piscirickettsia salmonis TaxID=1238 RepID=UPI001E3D05EC|nr:methyl-accepting chemotaxis protein [Piscirickettsia salmonis]